MTKARTSQEKARKVSATQGTLGESASAALKPLTKILDQVVATFPIVGVLEGEIAETFDVECGHGSGEGVIGLDTPVGKVVTVEVKNIGNISPPPHDCHFRVVLGSGSTDGMAIKGERHLAPGEPTAFFKVPNINVVEFQCSGGGPGGRCKGTYRIKVYST